MPYKDMPWIRRDETLYLPDKPPIRVGSPDWFLWLAQTKAFCYQPPYATERLTIRKEIRRQKCYWYAYLKDASKLHNTYVGKTESLTIDRLHLVFENLMVRVRAHRQRSWSG
jgi:LuxR family transcriptional regulator, maltose regulon positive regulatory protein